MARQRLKDQSTLVNQLCDDHLISKATVCSMMSLSYATIWKLQQQGRFPTPIRLSPRRSAWRLGDVRSAIKQLAAEVV